MKTLISAEVNGKTLTILVEAEGNKATISYFVDGIQIIEWNKISIMYQTIFAAMVNDYCDSNNLVKWNY
jgi:hypothetical protein